ncbi:MAG: restriction endonuclease [Candidatus Methanosuratincola petrocarbonis]
MTETILIGEEVHQTKFTISYMDKEKTWTVEKKEVNEILQKVPLEKIPNYIEMCILVGDIVINYASIQTSEECIEKYFGSISQEFRDKVKEISELKAEVEKEISEELPTIIKEKIELEIKSKMVELETHIKALSDFKNQLRPALEAELSGPLGALEQIKNEMPDSIKKQLDGQIDALRKVTDSIPNMLKGQLDKHVSDLEHNIEQIKTCSESLSQYVKMMGVATGKGTIGEEIVYTTLVNNFKDDTFELVSKKGGYSDILVKESSELTEILIEVKNYKNEVPSEQVEKFWRDLDLHKAPIGCFISLGSRIQGSIGDYKIETRGNKIGVFLNVGIFNTPGGFEDGIKMAYFITRKFSQALLRMRKESLEEDELRKKIDFIYKEIDAIKSQIDRISKVGEELTKISSIANKSIIMLNEIYAETQKRISSIFT